MATFPTSPRPSSVVKSPVFSTVVVNYGNTIEQRIQLNTVAQYQFELMFNVKDVSEFETFVDFFLARKGSFEAFYFQNTAEAYRTIVWQQNHAYSAGDIIRPTIVNGHSYICTGAGTSGGTEPASWLTTVGATVADAGVTWTENTYTVRFATDSQKFSYFYRSLMEGGTISLISIQG